MNQEPLVSVVMAAYNSSGFIEEAIDSVLNQTYRNIELIIVDDSSTDTTAEIAKSIAAADKRVQVYTIPHAGFPSVPRNYGIKKSNGELIAFIDSDDIWTKEKLKTQTDYFKKNPELSFIYSASVTFGDVKLFSPEYEVLPLFFRAAKNRDELIKKGNTIPLSSVLVNAAKLKEINGFDEDPEIRFVEDYELWLRLSEKGKFHFIPRLHVFYRVHGSQFSADWETKKKRLANLSQKSGINLPSYKFYRRKGSVYLVIRNSVHFFVYLWMRLLDTKDKIFR